MENFLALYNELNGRNLEILSSIYANDIHFIDPAHEIKGLPALTAYFASLYENISSIHFNFLHHQRAGEHGYVQWLMEFSHPRLKGGKSIIVPGTSYLRFNEEGKICHHHDYFDLGGMLYEQLPLFGKIISHLKKRLGS